MDETKCIVNNIFFEQAEREGYEDIADFRRRTRIDLTFETLRRIFHLGEETTPQSAMVLMKHLNFTNQAIADYISKTWPNDGKAQDIASLINTHGEALASWEIPWLQMGRKMRGANKRTFEEAVRNLLIYGKSIDVDLAEEVNQILGR